MQNRTENSETLVFRGEVHEIAPAAILEFPVPTGVPAILYVRSCITLNDQSVCEWAPKTLDAGTFYAMVRTDTAGPQTGSSMSTIDLRAVVAEGVAGGVAESAEIPAASGPLITCRLIVPALNIRSGPGLQYDIIGKVRSDGAEQAEIAVIGRSADNEWMTVDPSVVAGGWINNNASFVTCAGNVSSLPIIDAPAAPAAENTPAPVAQAPTFVPAVDTPAVDTPADATSPIADQATESADQPGEPAPEITPEPAAEGSVVPQGLSLLVVNNGFEHEMRFTIDQVYRPEDGPSEYDLQPGESVSLVVFPGNIAFTASSPWNGLSQNAEIVAERDQAMSMWLRFEHDAGGYLGVQVRLTFAL